MSNYYKETTKFKGTKDSVCNECYDNGFKGSPCPHIDVQQYQDDIKTDLQEYERGYEQGKLDGLGTQKAEIISLIYSMILNKEVDDVEASKIINKIRK